jgi:hypothetical protein
LVSASIGALNEKDVYDADFHSAIIFCMDTLINSEVSKLIK